MRRKQTLSCKAFRRQNALQDKKRDIFPAGKVWFSPSAPPPIFPRSGNSLFGSQTKCARQIYSPLSALHGSKKLDSENFKPKRAAMKFSTNIISATVYLFAGNPCLREQPDFRGVVNTAVSTLRCQHCGVAPTPTRLHENLGNFRLFANQITHFFESSLPTFFQESRRPAFSKSFPSIRKPNNTFFLKVLCLLSFKKVGAQPFWEG